MLVLSRKLGESIIIDGGITVTITKIDGNKVSLGISAPPEITIDREEVHRARHQFAETEERSAELVGAGV